MKIILRETGSKRYVIAESELLSKFHEHFKKLVAANKSLVNHEREFKYMYFMGVNDYMDEVLKKSETLDKMASTQISKLAGR